MSEIRDFVRVYRTVAAKLRRTGQRRRGYYTQPDIGVIAEERIWAARRGHQATLSAVGDSLRASGAAEVITLLEREHDLNLVLRQEWEWHGARPAELVEKINAARRDVNNAVEAHEKGSLR